MANLRLAMDAAFWDLRLSTPQTLEGTARSVPGEPAPLDMERASKAMRPQQLALLRNGFPLGVIPSLGPPPGKDHGCFSIQSLFPGPSSPNWWVGFIGQFRPMKLFSSVKAEVMACEELDLTAVKDIAKHFFNKSPFSLGMFSQVAVAENTSLLFNVEGHGNKKGRRTKAMVVHQLPDHEITLEAAWPELFMERNGAYWDVPGSISLDLASLLSESGFRYRFSLHKNSGEPQAFNDKCTYTPLALLPGLCAKAAFSYEKSKDFWREREEDSNKKAEDTWLTSYDARLKEPHAAISAIVGGSFAAWLGGDNDGAGVRYRSPFSGDLFGSLCSTFQHGKFKNDFLDLTRIDARLDVSSAKSFIKGAKHLFSDRFRSSVELLDPLASPKLGLILQQQVAGPILFRVDSRISFNSPSGRHIPVVEDVMYGLSYSLRLLESGKVLAWYSPKRKEAMIELRLFEF